MTEVYSVLCFFKWCIEKAIRQSTSKFRSSRNVRPTERPISNKAKVVSKLKKQERREAARKKGSAAPDALEDGSLGEKAVEFKGYDLQILPSEALPLKSGLHRGRHSYTVNLDGGAAT